MGYTHGRMSIVIILHEWIWQLNFDFLILKMQHIILISIFFSTCIREIMYIFGLDEDKNPWTFASYGEYSWNQN
jgi:hypothetical protein